MEEVGWSFPYPIGTKHWRPLSGSGQLTQAGSGRRTAMSGHPDPVMWCLCSYVFFRTRKSPNAFAIL